MLRKDIPNSEAETPNKLIGYLGILVMIVAIAIPISSLHFLLLYGCVITITLFVCGWLVQDPTKNQALPLIPTTPDPYKIAYLDTGEIGVVEVAVIDLIQRDYLQVINKELIQIGENRPDPSSLTPIQRQVYDWFSTPRTANLMYFLRSLTEKVQPHCTVYQQQLQDEQLLNSDQVKARKQPIGWIGTLIIVGLGGLKCFVAVLQGHYNIGYLIFMCIVSLCILWSMCKQTQRRSHLGEAYLKQLKETFAQLKQRVKTIVASEMDYNMVVALFGITALAGTQYEYYQKISSPNTVKTNSRTSRTTSSSNSSCSGAYSSCGSTSGNSFGDISSSSGSSCGGSSGGSSCSSSGGSSCSSSGGSSCSSSGGSSCGSSCGGGCGGGCGGD